ncbi:MAG: SDR family NAD(P)-dependent oxidoreductase, partial [Streptococcaceae bacterium]|nr:SDR family NAD(P)-dependent oxidoreductase [Streptococcaceae bacterium]
MSAALIMGASGDIGEAIAFKLADEGYSLYLHYYKNNKKTLKILQKLQAKYPKQDFFMVSLDMTKEEMIPSFLEQLFQIDMIIFASGISYYTLVKDMTGQQLEELWQIHLKTPILL